jgi:hypothetical protein
MLGRSHTKVILAIAESNRHGNALGRRRDVVVLRVVTLLAVPFLRNGRVLLVLLLLIKEVVVGVLGRGREGVKTEGVEVDGDIFVEHCWCRRRGVGLVLDLVCALVEAALPCLVARRTGTGSGEEEGLST